MKPSTAIWTIGAFTVLGIILAFHSAWPDTLAFFGIIIYSMFAGCAAAAIPSLIKSPKTNLGEDKP